MSIFHSGCSNAKITFDSAQFFMKIAVSILSDRQCVCGGESFEQTFYQRINTPQITMVIRASASFLMTLQISLSSEMWLHDPVPTLTCFGFRGLSASFSLMPFLILAALVFLSSAKICFSKL